MPVLLSSFVAVLALVGAFVLRHLKMRGVSSADVAEETTTVETKLLPASESGEFLGSEMQAVAHAANPLVDLQQQQQEHREASTRVDDSDI